MWKKLKCIFTPLRTLSILLIILATLDHLYNPFLHTGADTSIQEWIIRIIFLFCGIFGLLGNGRYLQLRATIVGFPYIYLATIYTIELINTGVQAIVIPLAFSSLIGVWTLIFGAYNEHRNTSLLNCISHRNNPQSYN
jgi:hypothetical protein